MSTIHLSLTLPSPLASLSLSVPSSTTLSSILPTYCPQLFSSSSSSSLLYLRTRSSIPDQDSTLESLSPFEEHVPTEMDLQVACRMLGGKGGFGAMLRATGGKMSSQKASNNDSCRDLSGRRLSTIKEAKKMADLLELESTHKKTSSEAAKAKLEALERSLGIDHAPAADPSSSSTSSPNATEPEGSNRPGPSKLTTEDLVQLAGKKHKFDDSEYLEQSREINDNVRSAVSAGLLKNRKKKAKLSASSTPVSTSSPAPVPATTTSASEVVTVI